MRLSLTGFLPVVPIITLALTLAAILLGALPFSPYIGLFMNLLVQICSYTCARILTLSDTEKEAIDLLRNRTGGRMSEEEFRIGLDQIVGQTAVDGLLDELQHKGLISSTAITGKGVRRAIVLTAKARYLH